MPESVGADEFTHMHHALKTCLGHELKEVELVLRISISPDHVHDMSVPVPEQFYAAYSPLLSSRALLEPSDSPGSGFAG